MMSATTRAADHEVIPASPEVEARSVTDFLNSLGAVAAITKRGENMAMSIECTRYLGLRWYRLGYENNLPTQDLLDLHKATGARFSYGLLSGGTDIARIVKEATILAKAGALLAIEGPNEPNNWGVTYQGEKGGEKLSWLPVAKLQRDLYAAIKGDPILKDYPVWSICENGAEIDNVGLQYLTIPAGAGTLMPEGTRYADYANCHNYIMHSNWPAWQDNQSWLVATPTAAGKADCLYSNYGKTWRKGFAGYSEEELKKLPRVTTETGCTLEKNISEEQQGCLFLDFFLAQFKQGWSYTALYLLRDRVDESGNQTFGFYRPDYSPRKSAIYLHNLTTILADPAPATSSGKLAYTIPGQPATVHDLLLQKGDGTFLLTVWGERFASGGSEQVTVRLSGQYGAVKIYDPTASAEPIQTLRNVDAVPLTLSTHPLILEFTR